jgi:mannan endo-1,4-beta-mannosidase
MHPAHAGGRVEPLVDYIDEVAPWLKALETKLHGRRHPVTVSVFGPELVASPALSAPIFRHPELDFANIHLYERGTIDKPRNTVAPALATGRLMGAALGEIEDQRPLFDSEHGPIHAFMDKKIVLSELFDDEYFRHMQWAHLASGGAGGGMRWPNRHPHVLTQGMRRAQSALRRFLPLIDWTRFDRSCWNGRLELSAKGFAAFGCGDEAQGVIWVLRTDATGRDGMIKAEAKPRRLSIRSPAGNGRFRVRSFDTVAGVVSGEMILEAAAGRLEVPIPSIKSDIALAVTRL